MDQRAHEPSSTDSEVLYAVEGRIATVTLNRPQRMNTISRPMLAQLSARLPSASPRCEP
jgi:enoyl-CoA hydratase/carnithine racemase